MEKLKNRILESAVVKKGNILKVDSFLNHQIDTKLLKDIGEEFHKFFCDEHITKILTIEASGIGVACVTAQFFDVDVLFAKKSTAQNMSDELYYAEVYSYTHSKSYNIAVSKQYLTKDDRVLIIDDFLAQGSAASGLLSIAAQAGAEVAGIGIVIEKGFQEGGKKLREEGHNLYSLAIVESMENGLVFRT